MKGDLKCLSKKVACSDNVYNYRVMVLKLLYYYVNMTCVIMCSQAEGKRPVFPLLSN